MVAADLDLYELVVCCHGTCHLMSFACSASHDLHMTLYAGLKSHSSFSKEEGTRNPRQDQSLQCKQGLMGM